MISPFCKHFYNLEDKVGLTLFLKKPREREAKKSYFFSSSSCVFGPDQYISSLTKTRKTKFGEWCSVYLKAQSTDYINICQATQEQVVQSVELLHLAKSVILQKCAMGSMKLPSAYIKVALNIIFYHIHFIITT
jgi:hypothetical protein